MMTLALKYSKKGDFLQYFLFWVAKTLFSVIFCFVLNFSDFSVFSVSLKIPHSTLSHAPSQSRRHEWNRKHQSLALSEITFIMLLRVRAFFHETVRVCHVYCNFKIGFTCWITVIFGTLKDGSLLINTLASNICFSYRNMFQNGVDALPKIVDAFL